MGLLWPASLFLLFLLPLLIAAYLWMLRRKRRFAVRYSSLSLVREAMTQQSRWRRHIPFALFLLAMSSLITAFSRPVSIVSIPTNQVAIILAMDVSRSMCSTDIEPNRLVAAEKAALSFVQSQPAGTQIGIVAFAGFAELILPPTTDQEVLQDVIQSLTTGRRTAIGSAIVKSIDAIAEFDPNVPASDDTLDATGKAAVKPTPVPKGAYAPDIIILLTDGASNAGIEPVEAAQQAADRGVRVYTIGFGTAAGGMMNCGGFGGSDPFAGGGFGGGGGGGNDPFGMGGGGGGNFGGGGGRFRRGIDEETLKEVAALTDGEYYSAESADELTTVFKNLPTYLIMRSEVTEVSAIFAGLGALLVAAAIGLSMKWQPLP